MTYWTLIKIATDWMVEYDTAGHKYRVSYFTDGHWKDEIIFDEFTKEVGINFDR